MSGLKELAEMAQKSGFTWSGADLTWESYICTEELDAFAKLVAAKEREACIVDIQMHIPRSGRHMPEYQMAMRMIERIRARA